jgi:uncharacterized CHY-type Zn-finger protein
MSAYSELLKSPHWQKKRLQILNRDGWKCRLCKADDKTLHVHHLRYQHGAKPWEYENDDLVSLCDGCHESFTKEDKRFTAACSACKRQNIWATRHLAGIAIGMLYDLGDHPELKSAIPEQAEVQGFVIMRISGGPDPFGWASAFAFSEDIKGMNYGEITKILELATDGEYETKDHSYYLSKIKQVVKGK